MEMILAFVIFSLLFAGMAIGLIMQNKPLKGSCGGVAKLMGKEDCDLCGGNPNKCDELNNRKQTKVLTDLAYNAVKPDNKK